MDEGQVDFVAQHCDSALKFTDLGRSLCVNMDPDSYSTVLYFAVYTPSANDPADMTVFVSDKRQPLLGCPDNDAAGQDNICVVSLIRGPTELIIQTRLLWKMIQNSCTSISERVAMSLGAN